MQDNGFIEIASEQVARCGMVANRHTVDGHDDISHSNSSKEDRVLFVSSINLDTEQVVRQCDSKVAGPKGNGARRTW